jgi:hypothetical protein
LSSQYSGFFTPIITILVLCILISSKPFMSVHFINSVSDFLGFTLSPFESMIKAISDLISLFIPIKIPSPKKSIDAIPIPRVKIGFLALQPVRLSASKSSQNPKATNATEPININNDFFLLE